MSAGIEPIEKNSLFVLQNQTLIVIKLQIIPINGIIDLENQIAYIVHHLEIGE